MTINKTQSEEANIFAEIKNEFMTTFDKNIGVNIANLDALVLYTDLANGDEVEISEIYRLLKTLD